MALFRISGSNRSRLTADLESSAGGGRASAGTTGQLSGYAQAIRGEVSIRASGEAVKDYPHYFWT